MQQASQCSLQGVNREGARDRQGWDLGTGSGGLGALSTGEGEGLQWPTSRSRWPTIGPSRWTGSCGSGDGVDKCGMRNSPSSISSWESRTVWQWETSQFVLPHRCPFWIVPPRISVDDAMLSLAYRPSVSLSPEYGVNAL